MVIHQEKNPKKHLTIDSIREFRELTEIKIQSNGSGLFMIGFWRKVEKTDKDYYTEYVNDERVLGTDQIEFLCDKDGASDFCSTMKYLIDYSGARYDKSEEGGYQITHIENVEFFNSVIDVSKKDLSNIKRAKLYNEKYFK